MLLRVRVLLFFGLSVLTCAWPFTAGAQMPSARQRIAQCWRAGAINTPMMQTCTGGLFVDTATFITCMQGGPCFGEAGGMTGPEGGGPSPAPPGVPFCGGPGQGACPQARACGVPGAIACPPPPGYPWPPFPTALACGAPPFPVCQAGLACGAPGALACPMPPMDAAQVGFGQLNPTLQINLPGRPGASSPAGLTPGVQLARPPLPEEQQLRQCYDSSNDREAFYDCLVERAMPREYRLTKQCLKDHADDSGRALVCSTGDQDLARGYDRYKEVSDCAQQEGNDGWDVAQCIGDGTLGRNERYYLGCVTRNKGDPKTAAVCALAKDLTPEQQIALSCAVSTGGNPKAFAVCTGGRLLERELNKCWENGIATNQGCFGPNNEYRRFLRGVDDQMRRALGENSVAYHAYEVWQNNVLAPGPNHEVIRHLNNGLSDLRNGPGPSNEVVKAGKALEDGVRSIGKVFGF